MEHRHTENSIDLVETAYLVLCLKPLTKIIALPSVHMFGRGHNKEGFRRQRLTKQLWSSDIRHGRFSMTALFFANTFPSKEVKN